MSCRPIKIELYVDVSSPLSYLQVERVVRVYETCSYRHNLDLRLLLLAVQENEPTQETPTQQWQAAAQEMQINLCNRVRESSAFYLQLAAFWGLAKKADCANEFLYRFLRQYWQTMPEESAESLLQKCSEEFALNLAKGQTMQLVYSSMPTILGKDGTTQHCGGGSFVPLCRVAHHVYLLGLCTEEAYRKAFDRMYDQWLECASLKEVFGIEKGLGT